MKLKVCGLSNPIEVDTCVSHHVDYCGFILNYPKSHRYISLEKAKKLTNINKGKIKKKLKKNEKIMLDGAHAETDAKNLVNYLKSIMVKKYGIWAMMKNKEPDIFIKQFKDTFKKIITVPIENEQGSMSAKELSFIALKNKFNVEKANTFNEALKKISSKEKKLIVCFGSLYNVGNILNKN
ncbi:hypothetical protein OAP71_02920 [Pelagibacteraceae bacterium]|nr:hypothetical protein [Pelagibacteraceae bacterium]